MKDELSPGRGDWDRILKAMDLADAQRSGMSLEEWKGIPESEQIRLNEDWQDSRTARENHRTTLEGYRKYYRRRIEAGELREGFGFPLWLRDQYAAERPVEEAVECLRLITEGTTATGAALEVILQEIDRRTGRGFIGTGVSFPEAKARLLAELDRAGLTAYFREAEAQQRERANR